MGGTRFPPVLLAGGSCTRIDLASARRCASHTGQANQKTVFMARDPILGRNQSGRTQTKWHSTAVVYLGLPAQTPVSLDT